MINITNITVDDFHPAPVAISKMAKGLDYGPQEWNGHTYNGIGIGYSPEGAYGYLGAIFGAPIKPKLEYFRLGIKTEPTTTYIHADSVLAKYAAVWYLSEAPDGVIAGTACWRHIESGLTSLPTREDMATTLGGDDKVDGFVAKLAEDGNDESKWQMTALVGQKFNRIAIYPTRLFHSRFPKDAWGETVNDGRIVWTTFFDI